MASSQMAMHYHLCDRLPVTTALTPLPYPKLTKYDGLVEKRRGLGMFVVAGAAARLATVERTKFLTEEWPRVCVKIERLGLSTTELLAQSIQSTQSAHSTKEGDPS
jgi:DNA-binding transcriptional regulator YhcF (GntR family)